MSAGTSPRPREGTYRRPKASHACVACKKGKTRCEILNPDGSRACHRCDILNLACSFAASPDSPATSSSSVTNVRAHSLSEGPSLPRTVFNMTIPSEKNMSHTERDDASITDEGASSPPSTPLNDPRSMTVAESATKRRALFGLVPTPYVGLFREPQDLPDWTSAPMLAMQQLVRAPLPDQYIPYAEISVLLDHILSPDQKAFLLDTFETQYAPWLNLPPHLDAPSPLTTLARVLIAARHLPPLPRTSITPQLASLTSTILPKLLFHPMPTTPIIQALLILVMWAPVDIEGADSAGGGCSDERLRAAAAVGLAANMRLDRAGGWVCGLRERLGGVESTPELEDAKDKARLWIALCNAEYLLCLGTNRSPVSRRTPDDLHAIETTLPASPSAASPLSPSPLSRSEHVLAGRDARLSLVSQLAEITEHAQRIPFRSHREIGSWYEEVNLALVQLQGVEKCIKRLSSASPPEPFHHHMLKLFAAMCRMLVLTHALLSARTVLTVELAHMRGPWYDYLFVRTPSSNLDHSTIDVDSDSGADTTSTSKHTDSATSDGTTYLASLWGQDNARTAEAILHALLAPSPADISTAPDSVFAAVAFACAFLVHMRFGIAHTAGVIVRGAADALLARTIEQLENAALTGDHAPLRCARFIRGLVDKWERRAAQGGGPCGGANGEMCDTGPAPGFGSVANAAAGQRDMHPLDAQIVRGVAGQDVSSSSPQTHQPPSVMDAPTADFGMAMDTDIFMDNDFWASFMESVSAPPDSINTSGLGGVMDGLGTGAN